MRIGRAGQSIFLDQAQYLQTVLEHCGMQNAKAVPTPLPAGYVPTKSLDKAANPVFGSLLVRVIEPAGNRREGGSTLAVRSSRGEPKMWGRTQ